VTEGPQHPVAIATCGSQDGVRQRSALVRWLDRGGQSVPGYESRRVELARAGDHACSDVLAKIRRAGDMLLVHLSLMLLFAGVNSECKLGNVPQILGRWGSPLIPPTPLSHREKGRPGHARRGEHPSKDRDAIPTTWHCRESLFSGSVVPGIPPPL
jgi:hypothetical protein